MTYFSTAIKAKLWPYKNLVHGWTDRRAAGREGTKDILESKKSWKIMSTDSLNSNISITFKYIQLISFLI